jgi:hypothetical protein
MGNSERHDSDQLALPARAVGLADPEGVDTYAFGMLLYTRSRGKAA